MNPYHYFLSALFTVLALAIFTASRPIDNLDDSLVGHYTFDNEHHLGMDNSTFRSEGEVKGNPNMAQGIVGEGCLELDGEGDYLEIIKDGKTPEHLQNLAQGSISLWFKARNIPVGTSISPLFHYGNLMGCENMKDASNNGLIIEIAHGEIKKQSLGVYFTVFNNACKLPTLCFDTHSDSHPEDTKGRIEKEQWYHFVAVVGADYNTGYLNGEEIDFRHYNFSDENASPFFKNALSHERLWVGKGFWAFAKETFFDGYIDDVRIYSAPLNSEEVKTLFSMRN